MTKEQTIKVLKGTLSLLHQAKINFDDVADYREASKIAIEAIEKQIPKKIKETDAYPHRLYCPTCYCTLMRNKDNESLNSIKEAIKYCYNCGQSIDFSEVE